MRDETTRLPWFWSAVLLVVLWRAAALAFPHRADTDPDLVRQALAPIGLGFVACGAWVHRRMHGLAARLFAGYCLGSGIHWGGPVGFGSPATQNLLLAAYVVISTALSSCLFLHLALVADSPTPAPQGRVRLLFLYLPALAGALLWFALLPRASDARWLASIGALFPLGVLYTLAGGVVWIRRWARADRVERRQRRLSFVVGAMLLGWLPHAVVSAFGPLLPPWDGLFNLPMIAIPMALALGLGATRQDENRRVLADPQ